MTVTTSPQKTTIRLKHIGGTVQEFVVDGIEKEPESLIIRIGFVNYNLLIEPNKLVRIEHGKRVKRVFQWSAESHQESKELFKKLLDSTPKVW